MSRVVIELDFFAKNYENFLKLLARRQIESFISDALDTERKRGNLED